MYLIGFLKAPFCPYRIMMSRIVDMLCFKSIKNRFLVGEPEFLSTSLTIRIHVRNGI